MTSPSSQPQRDPERTREEILDVALREFARNGYAGARVDEIAARTRTTKRMIYYYFAGKEQLYIAVLSRAYPASGRPNGNSTSITWTRSRRSARWPSSPSTITSRTRNSSGWSRSRTSTAASSSPGPRPSPNSNSQPSRLIARILDRGRDGVFLRQVEAIDVHMMISAFCFFRVANRHTFGALFDVDMLDPVRHDTCRRMIGDMIVSYLSTP